MVRRIVRVYADTSVFGGVFDREFARGSRAFLEQVDRGLFHLVESVLVSDELRRAPQQVRDFAAWFFDKAEEVRVTPSDRTYSWFRAEAVLSGEHRGEGNRAKHMMSN